MKKQAYILILATLLTGVMSTPLLAASVTLAWDTPATTVEGYPLPPLDGYKIYYGTEIGSYTSLVEVGDVNSTTISNLACNQTYYFTIKACTICHCESAASSPLPWDSPLMLDNDGDDLPDDWENLYFQNVTVTTGDADSDGDGLSDHDEFIAGTDPSCDDSVPELTASLDGQQLQITFAAATACGVGYDNRTRYYTLEQCTDLVRGNWEPVPEFDMITATNQVIQYASPATGAAVYYKTTIVLE